MIKSKVLPVVITVLALSATPTTAHAYLDAGTGSLIIQAIIAGGAAGAFIIKMKWRQIRAKLTGQTPESDSTQSSSESEAG